MSHFYELIHMHFKNFFSLIWILIYVIFVNDERYLPFYVQVRDRLLTGKLCGFIYLNNLF